MHDAVGGGRITPKMEPDETRNGNRENGDSLHISNISSQYERPVDMEPHNSAHGDRRVETIQYANHRRDENHQNTSRDHFDRGNDQEGGRGNGRGEERVHHDRGDERFENRGYDRGEGRSPGEGGRDPESFPVTILDEDYNEMSWDSSGEARSENGARPGSSANSPVNNDPNNHRYVNGASPPSEGNCFSSTHSLLNA